METGRSRAAETLPKPAVGEKSPSSHRVWGEIEVVGSESSEAIRREMANIEDKVTFLSVTDSSDSVQKKQLGVDGKTRTNPQGGDSPDDSSDEEEEELDPDSVDESLVTLGGPVHPTGKCRPCHFLRSTNKCRNGSSCTFCHAHPAVPRKRPGKRKRAQIAARLSGEVQAQSSAPSKVVMSL
mmetsp:Transcript_13870/g.39687  ORF Transcript_13870/g.39687 Transcript_13870/m.39687 type:complete len:182 (-) Transcript_13870:113-658(-)